MLRKLQIYSLRLGLIYEPNDDFWCLIERLYIFHYAHKADSVIMQR
jgi:hypothetical protein